MPHKRPKRAVRDKLRSERGTEQAPSNESLRDEPIPKSALRVLNALSIQEAWKAKKRKLEDGDDGGEPSGKRRRIDGKDRDKSHQTKKHHAFQIQPRESIQHFNRRVEDDLRPLVKSAMQTGRAISRKAEREQLEARKQKNTKGPNAKSKAAERSQAEFSEPPPPPKDKHADRPKEFATAALRRLNDIARAPPELKKLPRGAAKGSGLEKGTGVLSMAQKAMMEDERMKVIARYRELKARRKQKGEEGE